MTAKVKPDMKAWTQRMDNSGLTGAAGSTLIPYTGQTRMEAADPCKSAVSDLKEQSVRPRKPISGFIRIQTCVAENACSHKSAMENPTWVDDVVPDFVNPFLLLNGSWKDVIEKCREGNRLFRGDHCRRIAAKYHILVDLQNALDQNGCGTEKDWRAVGNIVTECVRDYEGADLLADWFTDMQIHKWRAEVRQKCIAHRSAKDLPVL